MVDERVLEDVVKVAERLLLDLDYRVACLVDFEEGLWKIAFRAERKAQNGEVEFTFDAKSPNLDDLLSTFKKWYARVWGFDLDKVVDDVLAMECDDDG